MTNRGQIVEKIVRKSGYSLTKLAAKLGISRNTLYNKFNNPNVGYRFIVEVGSVLYYDFTIDFPEMKQGNYGIKKEENAMDLVSLHSKYTTLLEKFNQLIEIVIKVAHEHGLTIIPPTINQLIEEVEQGMEKA